MATALQQQLAAIAANSTHQLDLKAQKSRHSKSLLFEPRDAASQNFETIFQICYEGFEELCMLDARFSPFARSLFSEQSKDADRTQMTAQENEELDRTIKSFLGLVSGRLLLKPAMKAVEWLVRRFSTHEHETEYMLYTFLPYHTSHIFPTLLSILPEQLPGNFKFLHPYVASLQSPPRHAVLAAAISNPAFFTTFSDFVLKTAKARQHSAVLVGFWASITAQAVNGMIDSTRSGRDSIRRQREEDLLLRILPILQSALSINDVPELYLGSCMIMTILATKASLEDKVLDALMETVAIGWAEQTMEDGLICLAVLAEEKQNLSQPRPVTRAILKAAGSAQLLGDLSSTHRTDKLVLATCLAEIAAPSTAKTLEFTKFTTENQLLPEEHLSILAEDLLSRTKSSDSQELVTIVSDLVADKAMASAVQKAAERSSIDLSELSDRLAITPAVSGEEQEEADADQMELDEVPESDQEKLDAIIASLPALEKKQESFLDSAFYGTAKKYSDAFQSVAGANQQLVQLLDLKALRKDALTDASTFLSFLAFVSAHSTSIQSKARALEIATSELKRQASDATLDLQALLPYAIVALADPSHKVRKSAATLCLQIYEIGKKAGKTTQPLFNKSIHGSSSSEIHWLPSQDAQKLLEVALIPVLEDCVLDGTHVVRSLADVLNGAEQAKADSKQKELKSTIRAAVCTLFAGHVANSPFSSVKLGLLEILKSVGKAASDARKTVLLPFVSEWRVLSNDEQSKYNDMAALDRAILGSLSHRSPDELQALKSIAAGEVSSRSGLPIIALTCLRKLWPSMKAPTQNALADFLLNLAVDGEDVDSENPIQTEALDALRNVHFSVDVLAYLIENLPKTSDLSEQTPPAKKRRTSKGDTSLQATDPVKLNAAIKRITIVLEAVEASKSSHQAPLLKGLFLLLGELHHYKSLMGSQLVYLQELLMGCLLSVVAGLKDNRTADIDRSVIRADLIVECVRTTSSTQVHNTALLLISNLATWAPDLVLHSVMPLFTFMSTTLLRQSDEYSAHVTDQTVARIVPPLAASLKKRGKDLVSGASELLLSFTAAFEHIPLHRRSGLFQHLVATLGAEETLFAVVAMLVERYPSDPRMVDFTTELMSSFPVLVQLQAFKQYIALIFDGLKPKRTLSNTILGFGEKDAEQIEDSVDTLLSSLCGLMESSTLRKRLAKELNKGEKTAQPIQALYADLLEQIMQLTRDLANNDELKEEIDSVLAALLSLTPTKDFIESSAKLMQSGSDQTRQQVFRSLEARVAQAKRGDATLQQVYIEVLPNCCYFINDEQPIETRRCAILCIDQIVEKYGKTDRTAVLNAAEHVASKSALGCEDASLQVISILCLASMTEVLEDDFISILPQVLTQILNYLDETLSAPFINATLHSAAFTFASAVLDHIPWMMSSQYLDRTILLAAQSAASSQSHSVGLEAEQFCSLAARKISAQDFFAAAERTCTDAFKRGPEAAAQHLSMTGIAIQHHTKATINKCAQPLFAVLLQAFDLRHTLTEADEEEEIDDEIFEQVDQTALALTLKLNDATFRPFFIRLVEYATGNTSKLNKVRKMRLTSLFSFSHTLFEQLKSIVTSYASFLLEPASALLSTLSMARTEDQELLTKVLETLSSSFRHDQDDFWQSPSHFEAIATPLLAQLETFTATTPIYPVIPAITELAAAASSPDHHKAMNTAIMACMRHEDASVRLAAVKCERAITDELNFDWLALLPEMLPFISELQEDDDENVERETLRWVKQIEDVTGESLEGMLQ